MATTINPSKLTGVLKTLALDAAKKEGNENFIDGINLLMHKYTE